MFVLNLVGIERQRVLEHNVQRRAARQLRFRATCQQHSAKTRKSPDARANAGPPSGPGQPW